MDGPRAPLEGEIPGIIDFLDAQLRPKESWSITSEYPTAFDPRNTGNIRIIKKDDKVLSHAVMRPLIVKTPAGLFKVAAIGSVVTDTEHRNQGLSRRILESCLAAADEHGCEFAILWTNLYDFYRKLGFELAGSEMSLLIENELNVPTNGFKFMCSTQVAVDAIHRLYHQHTVVSLRTLEETQRYLQIPNSRIFTAWTQQGTLAAYAVEGKGADLGGYIHEWGGGGFALLPLFSYIRKTHGGPITIITPSHSRNLIQQTMNLGATLNEGFLGMVKILKPMNLISKIKRYSRMQGVDNLALEWQQDSLYIGSPQSLFKTNSENDMVRLIFGPQKASEIYNGFDQSTCEMLETVFPIPMWIWGWDSI